MARRIAAALGQVHAAENQGCAKSGAPMPTAGVGGMCMRQNGLVAAAMLLICLAIKMVPARADELVQIQPHRAVPIGTAATTAPPLFGYLARPSAQGRHPAVVLLHWCSGFSEHDIHAASMLRGWGYVALALDSLGESNLCAGGGGAMPEAQDAYAALHYLAAQDFVDPDRVAVMGWSMGGGAVLTAVEQGGLSTGQELRFKAAIAYYPPCAYSSGTMTAPTLVIVGENDDWEPAGPCRAMAAHQSDIGITRTPGGAPVTLVVLPGATHSFDTLGAGGHYLGHLIRPDAGATQAAVDQVRAFLRENLE
jgi:dienelactone hydrolase